MLNSIHTFQECVENCLNDLGSDFMQHERLTFKTYSSYYETLLRQQEKIIQLKEQEVNLVLKNC